MHPTSVPYAKLILNPAINARGKLTDHDVADLVASIPARGLLQPLLVRPLKNGNFEIAEGSRRHRAIGILIKKKLWKKDADIPVLCQNMTDEEGREASLLANVQRLDLSPAEEAGAFTKLEEDGQNADAIAAHFGVPVRRVQQRLAIGKLPLPIFNALEDGTITVEAAQAFTLSKDEGLQLQVFNDLEKTGRFWPNSIRDALVKKSVAADSREAKFVGETAYVEAGGNVTRDLFSENVFFEDGPLLQKLFDAKIQEAKATLLEAGWSDVVIARDGKPNVWDFTESTPDEKNLSEETRSRLAAIKAECADIGKQHRALNDEEDGDEYDGDAVNALEDARNILESEADHLRSLAFTDRQKKKCIAIINIDYSSVNFHLGLIDPKQAKSPKSAGGRGVDDGEAIPAKGGSTVFEEADFSGALLEDMSITMDGALRAAMIAKPTAANYCLLAAMVMAAQSYIYDSPLHVGQGRNGGEMVDDMVKSLFGVGEDDDGLHKAPGFADILAKLETLDADQFGRLVGAMIARHLNVTRRLTHHNVQALITRMDPDVSALWKPDAAFFKKLKGADLTECLIEVNHGTLPEGISAKPKKAELVAKATEIAPRAGWLPKPLRTACYVGPGSEHYKPPESEAAPADAPSPPPEDAGGAETQAAEELELEAA